jgi:hypothetical protein
MDQDKQNIFNKLRQDNPMIQKVTYEFIPNQSQLPVIHGTGVTLHDRSDGIIDNIVISSEYDSVSWSKDAQTYSINNIKEITEDGNTIIIFTEDAEYRFTYHSII